MRRTTRALGSLVVGAIATSTAYAQSVHFQPGVFNVRDLSLPPPGIYGALYNYGYLTDRLNDANGNQISSLTITGPGGKLTATVNIDVNVNLYALIPAVIWVPKQKFLGARYGIMLAPSFTNASLDALISLARGTGQNLKAGQFNVGDAYVAPLWLCWSGKHYDVNTSYGFYIPDGKYSIQTLAVPVIGPVRVASPDNTGLGFWENQNQNAVYLYPWADHRMAIQNAMTWEISRQTRGFDLTNGQYLTWNWGVSEYLPLKKDQSLLAEIGAAGYGSFQVTDNTGTAAANPNLHEKVWAAGMQVGVTIPKKMMVLNFHWLHEYSAANRFQGTALGISFVAKF